MRESPPTERPGYYGLLRLPIASQIPPGEHRVLDVGCGEGALGRFLLAQGRAKRVEGMELDEQAAARAKASLDHVVICDLNRTNPEAAFAQLQERSFDYVICADVLEHLVDPWRWLQGLAGLLAPGGTAVVSLPNLRCYRALLPLLLLDRFDYRREGILDRSHLRFFTARTARQLLEQAGLRVVKVQPLWWGWKAALVDKLTLSLFRGLLCPQWLFVGRTPETSAGSNVTS